jgi:hypothetical protein
MSFQNTETAFDLFSAAGAETRSFGDGGDASTAVDDQQSTSSDCESFQDNPFSEATTERKDEKEISFLVQSTMSNMVFLTAGAMYLTTAIWDLRPPKSPTDILVYNIIGYMAPITYLFNSLIDIHLANRIRRYKKKKKRASSLQLLDENNNSNAAFKRSEQEQEQATNITTKSTTKGNKLNKEKVRKFAAHRRELSAAMSFFIAALFSVLSILAEWMGDNETTMAILDGISVHTYVISAIIAIVGSRIVTRRNIDTCCLSLATLSNDADTLETLGDVFFLIGSIVDAVLFDCHFDDEGVGWPILSSVLWCIDALLYLNSDWTTANQNSAARL